MTSLPVKNIDLLVSMDDAGSRWKNGGIYVTENVIQNLGPSDQLPRQVDQIIDGRVFDRHSSPPRAVAALYRTIRQCAVGRDSSMG